MEHTLEKLPDVDLSCNILGTKFDNPIWLGSGSIADNKTKVDRFLASRVGAIIPRTTRLEYAPGRETHPSYHLYIDPRKKMMRNCEWTGNILDYWRPYLLELAASKRVIMSVSGRDIAGCRAVCEALDPYQLPMIEINVSCAHSNEAHGYITRDEQHIRELVGSLKKSIKTPLALKLGHSDRIVPLAKFAEEEGADAIVAINTVGPVLDFDLVNGKPKTQLGIRGGKGGLSGAPIFQTALTDVYDLAQKLHIPIIACGGIVSAEDAVKMLMAGASAVQVYSAAHIAGSDAPKVLDKMVDTLKGWMQNNGYQNLDQLRGIAAQYLPQENNMEKKVPVCIQELCVACNKCVKICLEEAITLQDKYLAIDKEKCVGCGACVPICPTNALV